jgi:hypothetical protein
MKENNNYKCQNIELTHMIDGNIARLLLDFLNTILIGKSVSKKAPLFIPIHL